MNASTPWLNVRKGKEPLILSIPHTGTDIPPSVERRLVSPWRARKDADWWVDKLYAFAADRDATIIRTAISRTVIDLNRDPSGVSLYPGQVTTELCPLTTFDGEPLYRPTRAPTAAEVADRRVLYFDPYHGALFAEIARLRATHERVVVYDCHSIRSVVPRLFEGTLPHFNIGTNDGASCDPHLTAAVAMICQSTGLDCVINGRFKGGYITRSSGRPADGVHAIQMELACRGYMREPLGVVAPDQWPGAFEPELAEPMVETLQGVLDSVLMFATIGG